MKLVKKDYPKGYPYRFIVDDPYGISFWNFEVNNMSPRNSLEPRKFSTLNRNDLRLGDKKSILRKNRRNCK